MIRILIVDDSKIVRTFLKYMFEQQPDMMVIGEAENGQEAVGMVKKLKPDVITMDIRMPVMDGFDATRLIMAESPTPIVVISANVHDDLKIAFNAIDVGALAVIEKSHEPDVIVDCLSAELIETVRAMSEIKVVTRRKISKKRKVVYSRVELSTEFQLIGIGVSTGGPSALKIILSALPKNFGIPIVVVQHIHRGFIEGMVRWLQEFSTLHIKLAAHGESLKPATVYFAPDDCHVEVCQDSEKGLFLYLKRRTAKERYCPSVNALFNSIATACPKRAIGGILTGMGDDGASGLLAMKTAGCHTFIQDKSSCVVYGMPQAALLFDAVEQIIPLGLISEHLMSLVHKNSHS